MPEILTESFCERCGTRYTFESAAPRTARLKGIKVLSRGLKNFVLSDDTSMDEAMAAARSDTDREATTQQLDAFHRTFNFCMSCRQYTCANCWNETEGHCLTCAPHLGHEIMPAPFPDLAPADGLALGAAATTNGSHDGNGHAPPENTGDALAWPAMDLDRTTEDVEVDLDPIEPIDAVARLSFLSGVTPPDAEEPVAAIDLEAAAAAESEAALRAPSEVEPQVESVIAADASPVADPPIPASDAEDVGGRAAVAAARTNDLMHRFRPGQSLDDEIAAYEREQAAAAMAAADAEAADAEAAAMAVVPEPAPAEPVVDLPAEPIIPEQDLVEPVVDPPAAAGITAEVLSDEPAMVEPAGAAAVGEPVAPEPVAPEPVAAERVDVVEQPTWRIVAPETEPPPTIPTAPPADQLPAQAAAPAAEPQWPTQPEWPSQRPTGGLPFLARPAAPTGGMEALWAESAREVASPTLPAGAAKPAGGVQPCVSCGLSLSATARFCRRCGTRQG